MQLTKTQSKMLNEASEETGLRLTLVIEDKKIAQAEKLRTMGLLKKTTEKRGSSTIVIYTRS